MANLLLKCLNLNYHIMWCSGNNTIQATCIRYAWDSPGLLLLLWYNYCKHLLSFPNVLQFWCSTMWAPSHMYLYKLFTVSLTLLSLLLLFSPKSRPALWDPMDCSFARQLNKITSFRFWDLSFRFFFFCWNLQIVIIVWFFIWT